MSNIQIRPLTIVLIVLAGLFVLAGIMYFSRTAADLPSFVPGHTAGSSHHHIKHGIAMFGLAVLALIGAWFTTAPERT
jgi:hypothetical protein